MSYDNPTYMPGFGQVGINQKPGYGTNTNELVQTHERRINAATQNMDTLQGRLIDTQGQLLREIQARQVLQARVDELEALVKQLAKSQLGLDAD